jgi:hypothetical protein
MNELLAVASAFTSGVADESLGFEIIGRTFCRSVESSYDILCLARFDNEVYPYFFTISELYRIWSPRLQLAENEENRRKIAQTFPQNAHVKGIGTD